MQRCDGTTPEQVVENMLLRDTIATHKEVTALLNLYTLEDGSQVHLD